MEGAASDSLSVLIKGVAAFVLGLLAVDDSSDEVVTQVRKRPGPDAFLEALAGVGKSPSYSAAAGIAQPTAQEIDELKELAQLKSLILQF